MKQFVEFHKVVPEAVEGETNTALDFHYQPRMLGSGASKINKHFCPSVPFVRCPSIKLFAAPVFAFLSIKSAQTRRTLAHLLTTTVPLQFS